MAATRVSQSFRTSDGEEFDSCDDAERHEAVLAAKESFETAAREYGEIMANEAQTADNERIELFCMHDYFYINPNYFGIPDVRRVSFYRWNCHYDLRDGLTISQETDGKYHHYPAKELYRHEKNAQRALIAAQRKRIQEFTDQVDREEKKLG